MKTKMLVKILRHLVHDNSKLYNADNWLQKLKQIQLPMI